MSISFSYLTEFVVDKPVNKTSFAYFGISNKNDITIVTGFRKPLTNTSHLTYFLK